jgi:hypothetical protein
MWFQKQQNADFRRCSHFPTPALPVSGSRVLMTQLSPSQPGKPSAPIQDYLIITMKNVTPCGLVVNKL